ncbi:MAG: asparagine synthase (glutamine-hydrolyzing) [Magnetococcales bacterium]|nr:asparagine synthase (glutamine-hydrolyzing) [Magnetococcales bacterium]
MCGITGWWDLSASTSPERLTTLGGRMTTALSRRGPDDHGLWSDAAAGIVLGHRRLAILDLSPAGHQPMVSRNGRFVLVYNGEIFNFQEIRAELLRQGCVCRSQCDTEVLLEACALWGVESTVKRCLGMFAFALWDRREKRLVLVRDRLGIKPLYWGRQGNSILFGSQPRSLLAHPDWQPRIDRRALAALLSQGYVADPLSIYQDLSKLQPGHIAVIPATGKHWQLRYWDLPSTVTSSPRITATVAEAQTELESLLHDVVQRRMVADVPLGAFLSGGVDSSLVTALMQSHSSRPVRSFSIGFREEGYNEAQHARAVAAHLGTDHTELYVDAQQAIDLVPQLAEIYDEPFADVSQIPTYLLCRLTRQHVTVALSGDGGDELFAGYTRYLMAQQLERLFAHSPGWWRQSGAAVLRAVSPALWDILAQVLPPRRRPTLLGDKLHKLAQILTLSDVKQVYPQLLSFWPLGIELVPNSGSATASMLQEGLLAGIEQMQMLDTLGYLPSDILVKVDRASMAVGLEARVPLLDHRLVEFAWRLPLSMKMNQGQGKWLLRQILYRYVPTPLIDRPKMGFGVPIGDWLRGPLRDWAETLLAESALRDGELLNPAPIRQRWREHLSGRRNWQYALWAVLMFQSWRYHWLDGPREGISTQTPPP